MIEIYIGGGAIIIIGIGVTIYLLKKNNTNKKGLLGENSGVDFILQKDVHDRSAFINEIDTIIKSSEELGKLLGGVSSGGKLYDKVLSDKNLIKQLRKAKSKEEVEKILKKWVEKKYPEIKKIIEEELNSTENGEDSKKLEAAKKKLEKAIKESGEDLKKKTEANKQKANKKDGEKGGDEGGDENKSEEKKKPKISEESQKIYKEVQLLLEKTNLDRLIDIINNLKDTQISELLDQYHKSLETDKLTLILKKADTPQDVINLLKTETINALKDEYERIKVLIGQARRKGHNVNAEWLALMKVPAKITMFAATFRKKDFEKVKNELQEIDQKINFMLNEDKKKEDEKKAQEDTKEKEQNQKESEEKQPEEKKKEVKESNIEKPQEDTKKVAQPKQQTEQSEKPKKEEKTVPQKKIKKSRKKNRESK